MSNRLSITAAAIEAGDRPAIMTAHTSCSFEHCARSNGLTSRALSESARFQAGFPHAETPRISEISEVLAAPTLETILAIYAALEAHRPIALLHPSSSDRLQRPLRDTIASAQMTDEDALILFTSGSTGPARGVVLSRTALLAAADASAAHLGWRHDDRWLVCLPLAHAGGLSIVIRCLVARKPIVLLEGDFGPERVATLISDARVTLVSLVPAQLSALLDDPSWHPPPHLRAVLLGGAAASSALIEAALARGVAVLSTYGLTETFGQVATARRPGGPLRPLPTVELVAGTHAAPAPIRIRGPMLATRYLDGTTIAPELVTSDLGYLDDGLHVIGRSDDVIISGGENVHPTEIEAVLAATPGVRAAAAFGVPDARWGQIIGAAIIVDPSFDHSAAIARWHAALPAHARPRRLTVVGELPRLASGKLDRRQLATQPTSPIDYA